MNKVPTEKEIVEKIIKGYKGFVFKGSDTDEVVKMIHSIIDVKENYKCQLDIANKKLDKIKKYTLKHRVDWGDPESQDGEDWELDGNDILSIIGGE